LVTKTVSVNLNKLTPGSITAPAGICRVNIIIIDEYRNYGIMNLFVLKILVFRCYFVYVFAYFVNNWCQMVYLLRNMKSVST